LGCVSVPVDLVSSNRTWDCGVTKPNRCRLAVGGVAQDG
jgi:hypothetical protein